MKYQANQSHVRVQTIGLNTVIVKDPRDLNNVRYLVVILKKWNDADLVANCGNYSDALKFAHSC